MRARPNWFFGSTISRPEKTPHWKTVAKYYLRLTEFANRLQDLQNIYKNLQDIVQGADRLG
jgi:hypothetical protein